MKKTYILRFWWHVSKVNHENQKIEKRFFQNLYGALRELSMSELCVIFVYFHSFWPLVFRGKCMFLRVFLTFWAINIKGKTYFFHEKSCNFQDLRVIIVRKKHQFLCFQKLYTCEIARRGFYFTIMKGEITKFPKMWHFGKFLQGRNLWNYAFSCFSSKQYC